MAKEFNPVLDLPFEAAEDLSDYRYHFVTIDTDGKVALLDSAGEIPIGVLQNEPGSGEEATVRVLGVSKVVANAALDEYALIKPEFVSATDCGKAASAGANKELACGMIIDASSAEDDLCSVLLLIGANVAGPLVKKTTVTTTDTDAAVTYTAAEILGGLILRDPVGSARADLFPTAASIIAAIPNCQTGDSFEVHIRNTADGAETITMTTNTGLTLSGTMTIAQNNAKSFKVVVTSATTVSIYSLGTVTF